jgi:hypothetical protein
MMTLANLIDKVVTDLLSKDAASPDSARNVLGSAISSASLRLSIQDRFSNGEELYTPTNRERTRIWKGAGDEIYLATASETKAWGRAVTYINRFPPESSSSSSDSSESYMGTVSPNSDDYSYDTTAGTRPDGSKYGECLMSQFTFDAAGRSYAWRSRDVRSYAEIVGVGIQYSHNVKNYEIEVMPHSAFLTDATLNTLRVSEEINLDNHVAERGVRLLMEALPNQRDFGLFRSLAELRDLPKTLRSSLELAISLGKGGMPIGQWVGKAHLTNEFGIQPVISDIRKLMKALKNAPRRIARLQDREFMDTSFHSTQSFWDDPDETKLSVPYNPALEKLISIGTLNSRRITLRSTVNANVRLPPIYDFLPEEFRWVESLGVNPRIADIYNLLPWTWLFDWFSGIGEYLHALESLNSDPSLINHGCISAKADLYLKTTSTHEYTSTRIVKRGVTTTLSEISKAYLSFGGHGHLKTYKRYDASALPDVASTSTMTGLSDWQASILGALALSRAK